MLDYFLAALGFIATAVTIIGFVYSFLNNFKQDVNSHIDRLDKRMDLSDDRMFLLANGKSIADAILEERLKRKETEK